MTIEPTTFRRDLLSAYDQFLFYERRLLLMEMYPDPEQRRMAEDCYPLSNKRGEFHFPHDRPWDECPQPSTRAEAVLTAAGCEWSRP